MAKYFARVVGILLVLFVATLGSRAHAQSSTTSMSCGQVSAGTTANCGTLTISSGSMYPEIIDQVSPSAGFAVTGGCTGTSLVYNSCSVSVSFMAGSTAGPANGTILISYRTCAYDAAGNETCDQSAATTKTVSISATVLAPDVPLANPDPPPSPTVPATPASAGPGDYSYLNCQVNLAVPQFCIVVPLN